MKFEKITVLIWLGLLTIATQNVFAESISKYYLPISFSEIEIITVTPNDQYSPTQYTVRVYAYGNLTGLPDVEMDVKAKGEIVDIDFLDIDDDQAEEFFVKTEFPNGIDDYHFDVFELEMNKLFLDNDIDHFQLKRLLC